MIKQSTCDHEMEKKSVTGRLEKYKDRPLSMATAAANPKSAVAKSARLKEEINTQERHLLLVSQLRARFSLFLFQIDFSFFFQSLYSNSKLFFEKDRFRFAVI